MEVSLESNIATKSLIYGRVGREKKIFFFASPPRREGNRDLVQRDAGGAKSIMKRPRLEGETRCETCL